MASTAARNTAAESGKGLQTTKMTRIVLRTFSGHDQLLQPLMSRAMAEAQSSEPSIWQARAVRARRIASMLSGRDAETVLAYAQECDELGWALSANPILSPSLVPIASSRAAPLMPSHWFKGEYAA